MGQKFVIEVARSDWGKGVEVVHPFSLRVSGKCDTTAESNLKIDRSRHILHTALRWKRYMSETRIIPSSVIALHAGVSPGRVRQILRLNNLDSELREHILAMDPATSMREFSEAKLRELLKRNSISSC